MSDTATQRSGLTTPTPWDQSTNRARTLSETGSRSYSHRESRDPYVNRRDSRETSNQRDRVERLAVASRQQHSRNGSGTTNAASAGDFNENPPQANGRRHDYDVQAMESDLSPRPGAMKNPIPAPTVTIRSEFPTLNRSRQQQSLTCLITIEVPEGNWRPDLDDLRHAPLGPPHPQDDPYGGVRTPGGAENRSIQIHYEPQENLEEIAEDLRMRVDNWHGLEFNRYARFLHLQTVAIAWA